VAFVLLGAEAQTTGARPPQPRRRAIAFATQHQLTSRFLLIFFLAIPAGAHAVKFAVTVAAAASELGQ
jgi:hypothetical protein